MCQAKYDLLWWPIEPYTEKHIENYTFHNSLTEEEQTAHQNPKGLIMKIFQSIFKVAC